MYLSWSGRCRQTTPNFLLCPKTHLLLRYLLWFRIWMSSISSYSICRAIGHSKLYKDEQWKTVKAFNYMKHSTKSRLMIKKLSKGHHCNYDAFRGECTRTEGAFCQDVWATSQNAQIYMNRDFVEASPSVVQKGRLIPRNLPSFTDEGTPKIVSIPPTCSHNQRKWLLPPSSCLTETWNCVLQCVPHWGSSVSCWRKTLFLFTNNRQFFPWEMKPGTLAWVDLREATHARTQIFLQCAFGFLLRRGACKMFKHELPLRSSMPSAHSQPPWSGTSNLQCTKVSFS